MKTVELTDRELELLIDALGIHADALNDSLVASGNPELADALTGALAKLRSPEYLQSTFEEALDEQAAQAS